MDSTSLTLGAAILLLLSFAIHRAGKPTPLPLIPHNNNLKWFVGDIPFIAKLAKERGGVSYAFDDTALRLGPVSQVCERYALVPNVLMCCADCHWTWRKLDRQNLRPRASYCDSCSTSLP